MKRRAFGGVVLLVGCADDTSRPDDPEVVAADMASMLQDAQDLSPARRGEARYLSLRALRAEGRSEAELELDRGALDLLVNLVSRDPELTGLVAVDGTDGTVLRLELSNYGWDRATWEAIAAESPYVWPSGSALASDLAAAVQTAVPWLPAAALVDTALYSTLAGMPRRLTSNRDGGSLEETLGFDLQGDIDQGRVQRAGLRSSAVTGSGRLLERHEGRRGEIWIAYHAAEGTDVVERPLEFHRDFDHAEIIFSLPNGLPGYMAVDGRGERVEAVPVLGDAVRVGVSCVGCHDGELFDAIDDVRAVYEVAPASDDVDAARVLELYPPIDAFSGLVDASSERFRDRAAALVGDVPAAVGLRRWLSTIRAPVDLARASAELGVEPATLREQADRLPDALSPLWSDAAVERGVWAEHFEEAACAVQGVERRPCP